MEKIILKEAGCRVPFHSLAGTIVQSVAQGSPQARRKSNAGKCLGWIALLLSFLLTPARTCSAGSTVSAWGYYYDLTIPETYRPIFVPAGLTNVIAVAGGYNHALALKSDGKVVGWGWSGNGGTNPPANLSNVVAIAAAYTSGLALKSDGTVVGWGYTSFGIENVPPGLSNIVDVTAGFTVAAALKADGTVAVWGGGLAGIPPQPPGLTNAISVKAGGDQILALRSDGTVAAWGNSESFLQTNVPVGLRNVTAIASGYGHNLALKTDGTVVVWGDDSLGQTDVPQGLSNVVAIAAGYSHSLALTADGNVIAWGAGTNASVNVFYDNGSLSFAQSLVPSAVRNVFAIAGGRSFSLAISGASGPPVIQTRLINQTVLPGTTVYMRVYATGTSPGYQWFGNGLAIPDATNMVLVLPNVQTNQNGIYSIVVSNQFGEITNSCSLTATPILATATPQARADFLGNNVSFSITAEGLDLHYQWQFNGASLTGETNSTLNLTNLQFARAGTYSVIVSNAFAVSTYVAPLVVKQIALGGDDSGLPPNLTNAVAIDAGAHHRLALRNDGTIVAWGDNSLRQTNVPSSATNIIAISAGGFHSLALRGNGTVVAWGDNSFGQTNVPPGLSNIVAVAGGYYHGLLLKSDGTLVAVGTNYGSAGNFGIPPGLTNVVAISAGAYNSAALTADGRVIVWGNNSNNQVDVPPDVTNMIAIAVGRTVDANANAIFALRLGGAIRVWGHTGYLEAGFPAGLSNVVKIAAANTVGNPTLALTADGHVVAWGAYANAPLPAGLHGVIAIANGDMALIGNGPPITRASLVNPGKNLAGFHVSLPTQYGQVYALEYKSLMSQSNWSVLPLIPGNGSMSTLTDTNTTNSQRFYRVRNW